ncbi:MAG: SprT-like domain-containing protein [Gemmatimonadales bacterium]
MNRKSEARAADEWLLRKRLEEQGLTGFAEIEVHENRSVMVSVSPGRTLRVHRGFAYAPDQVIRSIVVFVMPSTRGRVARRAKQQLLSFPVDAYVVRQPTGHRRRNRPEDMPLIRKLGSMHRRLNALHFGGQLTPIPIRISNRMKRRLGEVILDESGKTAREIAVSRVHVERDGWGEVEVTLLHEMVHQWQAEVGSPVDHGGEFRRKAREIGIPDTASRRV